MISWNILKILRVFLLYFDGVWFSYVSRHTVDLSFCSVKIPSFWFHTAIQKRRLALREFDQKDRIMETVVSAPQRNCSFGTLQFGWQYDVLGVV